MIELNFPEAGSDTQFSLQSGTFCLAAGTLVHTQRGPAPIETIQPGDWVLEDTGAHDYTRVLRTFKFEEKAVYRLSYCGATPESYNGVHSLIVTANHSFFVSGYDPSIVEPVHLGLLQHQVGWRRADLLELGALLVLANGESVIVISSDPIWRSNTEGIGWIAANRDAELGTFVDLRDGKHGIDIGDADYNDLTEDGDFENRYALGTEEHWAFKCDVFNFEIESFHTCYVGQLGVWVHNGNCFVDDTATVTEATRGIRDPIGCFVAGTLVHSRDGPVAIEQVKVGDSVLSQPESTGPRSFKRVINTFRFEGREVYVVKWYTSAALAVARQASTTVPLVEFLAAVVTGTHPFWVKGLGWTRADHLENHHELEMADGRAALVSTIDKVYRTTVDDVGWVRGRGIDDDYGRLLDLRGGQIVLGQDRVLNDGVDWWEGGQWFLPTVYNIEGEDNHTFYVDALGVWVHDESSSRGATR